MPKWSHCVVTALTVGGTRADHDKNYNTHVWSHWLKADFMGNWARLSRFSARRWRKSDLVSHYIYSEAAFDIYNILLLQQLYSLFLVVGLNTWSHKNVQLWTNETRTFLSCTISRLLRLLHVCWHYVWFSQFWSHFWGTNALFASKAERRVPKGYFQVRPKS